MSAEQSLYVKMVLQVIYQLAVRSRLSLPESLGSGESGSMDQTFPTILSLYCLQTTTDSPSSSPS
jgi:hypothetical protein